ncbi:T9SS type A sorting domain-containing protein [Bacteroidota bacterium]
MLTFRNKKPSWLRFLVLILMVSAALQLNAQEQTSSTISSGGGFSSGEGYSNFSVVGGSPVHNALLGGTYSGSVGFLFNNTFMFEKPDFNLYAEVFPEGAGVVIGAGIYKEGDFIEISAMADTGYVFLGWASPAGVFSDVNTDLTFFTMPGEEVMLTAYFEEVGNAASTSQINVSAFPADFGTIAGSGEYINGSTLNLTAEPAEGYRFLSWTENDVIVGTSQEYVFEVSKDRNLVANYALKRFTVSVESMPLNTGGLVIGGGTFDYGTEVTVTASPNLGFNFEGWKESGVVTDTGMQYTFVVKRDRVLTGMFDGQKYSINGAAAPTGSVSGSGDYYYGDIVSMEATPSSGYYFIRWMDGESQVSVRNPYLFSAMEDRSLTAEFAQIWWEEDTTASKNTTYLVTSGSTPEGVGIVLGQGRYATGEQVTLTASPNSGINFVKWMENGADVVDGNSELVGASYTFTADMDRELTAVYDGAKYDVSASANPTDGGETSVSNDGLFFPGDLATVSSSQNTGFNFQSWTMGVGGQQVSVNPEYSFTVTENRNLVANYKEIPSYTLSIKVVPEGAATVTGAGEYASGSEVAISVSPTASYSFLYWSKGVELLSYASDTSFVVEGDVEVTAYLVPGEISVTYLAGENGSLQGTTAQSVAYGTDATAVEAIPDDCYVFVSWSDGVTDNPRTDLDITSSLEVTATFEEVQINNSIIVDSTFTLTANQEGATYQWFDCSNGSVAIEDATGQSFTPTDTSGTYSVMIIMDGCEVMSSCISATSVGFSKKQAATFDFNVYPNPARDVFTISSPEAADIMVVNSLGQKLRTFKLTAVNGYRIHVDGLKPGIYFVIGQFENERITKRVIIAE